MHTQRLAMTDLKQHFCEQCADCGVALPDVGQQAWAGFYCVDRVFGDTASAGLQLNNTLNRYYQCHCPVFMNDLLGLQISVGSIQNCIVESAHALSPIEE